MKSDDLRKLAQKLKCDGKTYKKIGLIMDISLDSARNLVGSLKGNEKKRGRKFLINNTDKLRIKREISKLTTVCEKVSSSKLVSNCELPVCKRTVQSYMKRIDYKYILFAFNILFWISGLILIVAGAYFLANGSLKYIDEIISSSTNRNILILFIVVGVIIFAIAFCGCCGAIKENRCLLGAYIIFLFIIIIAEVIFGIFAIINKSTIQQQINIKVNETILEKYGDRSANHVTDPTIIATVDNLQQLFQCCGVNGYSDWQSSNWFKYRNNRLQVVPASCCIKKDNVPLAETKCWEFINSENAYLEGCVPSLLKYIQKNLPVVIGVALGIAFFEVFVVICAFCLCRHTDTQRQAV